MLLDELESSYKHTKDWHVLNESFHNTDLNCPTTTYTIINLLSSNNTCMIRWVLCNIELGHDFEDGLLALINNEDVFVSLKACQLLTRRYENKIPNEEYLVCLKSKLKNSQTYEELMQVLDLIAEMLANKRYSLRYENCRVFDRNTLKTRFANDDTFMYTIISYLKVKETQYYALKVIWVLSFNKACLSIIREKKIEHLVIKILREKSREKIMRVCLGIIRNYLERGLIFSVCTAHDLNTFCENVFIDEDMNVDIKYIKEKLSVTLKKSSSIDSYLCELFSGKLEESPYHFNDAFWEANVETLMTNKVEIIKAIKKYLKSPNSLAVWVSANDLYRFVKVAPEIGTVVIKYGLKDDLFVLTSSGDEDIRFHAIQALATCIFCNWA